MDETPRGSEGAAHARPIHFVVGGDDTCFALQYNGCDVSGVP